MKIINQFGWFYYLTEQASLLKEHKCGKWMYFFDNQEFAKEICEKSIEDGVCYESKCSDLVATVSDNGVICFYCNCDDIENHKRIIKFMIDNKLIRKTKSGRYYNNSFKLDDQTMAGQYGNYFTGTIKLSDFINLETGEFI